MRSRRPACEGRCYRGQPAPRPPLAHIVPPALIASETLAECAFSTVSRGHAEGGPHEPALATYPSRRFVSAGGLTVFHDGLLEHELVDAGGTSRSPWCAAPASCRGPLRPHVPTGPARPPWSPEPRCKVPRAALRGRGRGRRPVGIGGARLVATSDHPRLRGGVPTSPRLAPCSHGGAGIRPTPPRERRPPGDPPVQPNAR